MQEVYAAQCAQDDEEQKIHHLVVGNLRIIEQILIVDKFCKMTDQSIDVIGVGEVTRWEPIRHDETDDRCKEVSEAEGIGEYHHHQP